MCACMFVCMFMAEDKQICAELIKTKRKAQQKIRKSEQSEAIVIQVASKDCLSGEMVVNS